MGLQIEFSEKFDEEAEIFQIRRSHVEQAINDPDKTEELNYEGLQLRFFLRRVDEATPSYYLLVETKEDEDGDKLVVYAAYKIAFDLHPALDRLSPLQVLGEFLERFGLKVRIGTYEGNMIMKMAIPIEPEKKDQFEFAHSGFMGSGSAWVKVEQEDGQWVAKSALAYTVNYGDYLEWLEHHSLVH